MPFWVFTARGPLATEAVGEGLGAALQGRDATVCLWGTLGAGKTTFARGIARGLVVSGAVSSPSFVLAHEHQGATPFRHVDLYRLAQPEELVEIGAGEWLHSAGVCAVEWPERLGSWLPPRRVDVQLGFMGAAARSVVVSDRGVGFPQSWLSDSKVEGPDIQTHFVF